MYQQKKPADYRTLWIISIVLLVIGILLTINLAMLRSVGFALLGVGGVMLVISLANMDKWKDELSEESIALIENVCYQPFREGFYEKHSKGVDFKSIFPTVLYGVLSTFYQGWVIFKNWKAIIAIPRD